MEAELLPESDGDAPCQHDLCRLDHVASWLLPVSDNLHELAKLVRSGHVPCLRPNRELRSRVVLHLIDQPRKEIA